VNRVTRFAAAAAVFFVVLRYGFGLEYIDSNRMEIIWTIAAAWCIAAGYDAYDEFREGNLFMLVPLALVALVAFGLSLPIFEMFYPDYRESAPIRSIVLVAWIPLSIVTVPITLTKITHQNALVVIPLKLCAMAANALFVYVFLTGGTQ